MATPRSALEAATAALARRDRSAAGLVAYLEQRGTPPDDAARAVEQLTEAGYVDDARFAVRRAEVLAERGHGDASIRFSLANEGVAPDEIEAALAQLTPERERAVGALRAAPAPLPAVRRLAAKGFAVDSIESALAALPGEQ
jgi:regulatory protein